jgi:hypothetical protein
VTAGFAWLFKDLSAILTSTLMLVVKLKDSGRPYRLAQQPVARHADLVKQFAFEYSNRDLTEVAVRFLDRRGKSWDMGKLEAYINAGQEAHVPMLYKALKAGYNGCLRGPEGQPVRAAAEARKYAATSSAVAEIVLRCSGDYAKPCCAKINSGD